MGLVDPYNNHFNMQDPPLNLEDDENLLQGSRKRKRNQHKKVVCVPITGDPSKDKGQNPPSDFWAWRKYGQKPIKGSPYPRGYYRCSSSKGCSARKQVERSRKDPSMLIVTYTAEHNHAMGKLSASSKHDVHDKESFKEDDDDIISNLSKLNQGHYMLQESNKGSLIHNNEIDMMEKYSDNASHFSCIIDSPSSSEYPFEEEKQVVDACAWICMEEGGHFQYVEDWKGGDAGKEDVCLASRSEGDDVFSELGMLPELASIFNKRDINDNIEERRGPDEIRSITLDHDLSIFGPLHSASPCPLA